MSSHKHIWVAFLMQNYHIAQCQGFHAYTSLPVDLSDIRFVVHKFGDFAIVYCLQSHSPTAI